MKKQLFRRNTYKYFIVIFGFIIMGCSTKYDYSYKIVTHSMGKKLDATQYLFTGSPKPPLELNNKNDFLNNVNTALEKLNLPRVNYYVTEKSKMTGFRLDRGIYEWEDYSLGTLQIHRGNGRTKLSKEYDCINYVSIRYR